MLDTQYKRNSPKTNENHNPFANLDLPPYPIFEEQDNISLVPTKEFRVPI